MLDLLLRSPRMYFVGVILITVPVLAGAPAPSQEFWEYMAEYSDDNGDALDPLEYDQILNMKETDVAQPKDADVTDTPIEKSVVDKVKVRNADMKFEQKSSLQSSSAAAKGARL